jgi:hypothetical protein
MLQEEAYVALNGLLRNFMQDQLFICAIGHRLKPEANVQLRSACHKDPQRHRLEIPGPRQKLQNRVSVALAFVQRVDYDDQLQSLARCRFGERLEDQLLELIIQRLLKNSWMRVDGLPEGPYPDTPTFSPDTPLSSPDTPAHVFSCTCTAHY